MTEPGPAGPSDPDPTAAELEAGIRGRDRRALAKAITLAESTRPDHRAVAEELLGSLLASTGAATRVGITGPPGAGKSTFIESLGQHVIDLGHRVAVLAVDPSSRRSGGSILGDKTRMPDLARREEAFIRPSPGAGQLGGVARHTRDVMLLCEAFGFDVVFVETIGVGQSEVAVADMVDLFLLLVNPGAGDELQGIKRGIMELADLIVVNKADGELAAAAGRTAADYSHASHLLQPRWATWRTEVLTCSSIERTGIPEVWSAAERFIDALGPDGTGELSRARAAQATAAMWSEIHDRLLDGVRDDDRVGPLLPELEAAVASGKVTPNAAARQVLAALHAEAKPNHS